MGITYNAHEIYEIGIEIEKNGKRFYLSAAEKTDDDELRKFFTGLAEWEQHHIELFEQLKNDVSQPEDRFDPDEDAHKYMKATADSHVFLAGANIDKMVEDCRDAEEALALALRFEKDSVVLYSSMKGLVREDLGRESIDKLINEEIIHVSYITAKLETLRGS